MNQLGPCFDHSDLSDVVVAAAAAATAVSVSAASPP